ncbi:hypothetical protein DIPPA_15319 [Diplonema papillatum]|nr:hypothetical protein DIPPA_15319 [Diplonema papillatum]
MMNASDGAATVPAEFNQQNEADCERQRALSATDAVERKASIRHPKRMDTKNACDGAATVSGESNQQNDDDREQQRALSATDTMEREASNCFPKRSSKGNISDDIVRQPGESNPETNNQNDGDHRQRAKSVTNTVECEASVCVQKRSDTWDASDDIVKQPGESNPETNSQNDVEHRLQRAKSAIDGVEREASICVPKRSSTWDASDDITRQPGKFNPEISHQKDGDHRERAKSVTNTVEREASVCVPKRSNTGNASDDIVKQPSESNPETNSQNDVDHRRQRAKSATDTAECEASDCVPKRCSTWDASDDIARQPGELNPEIKQQKNGDQRRQRAKSATDTVEREAIVHVLKRSSTGNASDDIVRQSGESDPETDNPDDGDQRRQRATSAVDAVEREASACFRKRSNTGNASDDIVNQPGESNPETNDQNDGNRRQQRAPSATDTVKREASVCVPERSDTGNASGGTTREPSERDLQTDADPGDGRPHPVSADATEHAAGTCRSPTGIDARATAPPGEPDRQPEQCAHGGGPSRQPPAPSAQTAAGEGQQAGQHPPAKLSKFCTIRRKQTLWRHVEATAARNTARRPQRAGPPREPEGRRRRSSDGGGAPPGWEEAVARAAAALALEEGRARAGGLARCADFEAGARAVSSVVDILHALRRLDAAAPARPLPLSPAPQQQQLLLQRGSQLSPLHSGMRLAPQYSAWTVSDPPPRRPASHHAARSPCTASPGLSPSLDPHEVSRGFSLSLSAFSGRGSASSAAGLWCPSSSDFHDPPPQQQQQQQPQPGPVCDVHAPLIFSLLPPGEDPVPREASARARLAANLLSDLRVTTEKLGAALRLAGGEAAARAPLAEAWRALRERRAAESSVIGVLSAVEARRRHAIAASCARAAAGFGGVARGLAEAHRARLEESSPVTVPVVVLSAAMACVAAVGVARRGSFRRKVAALAAEQGSRLAAIVAGEGAELAAWLRRHDALGAVMFEKHALAADAEPQARAAAEAAQRAAFARIARAFPRFAGRPPRLAEPASPPAPAGAACSAPFGDRGGQKNGERPVSGQASGPEDAAADPSGTQGVELTSPSAPARTACSTHFGDRGGQQIGEQLLSEQASGPDGAEAGSSVAQGVEAACSARFCNEEQQTGEQLLSSGPDDAEAGSSVAQGVEAACSARFCNEEQQTGEQLLSSGPDDAEAGSSVAQGVEAACSARFCNEEQQNGLSGQARGLGDAAADPSLTRQVELTSSPAPAGAARSTSFRNRQPQGEERLLSGQAREPDDASAAPAPVAQRVEAASPLAPADAACAARNPEPRGGGLPWEQAREPAADPPAAAAQPVRHDDAAPAGASPLCAADGTFAFAASPRDGGPGPPSAAAAAALCDSDIVLDVEPSPRAADPARPAEAPAGDRSASPERRASAPPAASVPRKDLLQLEETARRRSIQARWDAAFTKEVAAWLAAPSRDLASSAPLHRPEEAAAAEAERAVASSDSPRADLPFSRQSALNSPTHPPESPADDVIRSLSVDSLSLCPSALSPTRQRLDDRLKGRGAAARQVVVESLNEIQTRLFEDRNSSPTHSAETDAACQSALSALIALLVSDQQRHRGEESVQFALDRLLQVNLAEAAGDLGRNETPSADLANGAAAPSQPDGAAQLVRRGSLPYSALAALLERQVGERRAAARLCALACVARLGSPAAVASEGFLGMAGPKTGVANEEEEKERYSPRARDGEDGSRPNAPVGCAPAAVDPEVSLGMAGPKTGVAPGKANEEEEGRHPPRAPVGEGGSRPQAPVGCAPAPPRRLSAHSSLAALFDRQLCQRHESAARFALGCVDRLRRVDAPHSELGAVSCSSVVGPPASLVALLDHQRRQRQEDAAQLASAACNRLLEQDRRGLSGSSTTPVQGGLQDAADTRSSVQQQAAHLALVCRDGSVGSPVASEQGEWRRGAAEGRKRRNSALCDALAGLLGRREAERRACARDAARRCFGALCPQAPLADAAVASLPRCITAQADDRKALARQRANSAVSASRSSAPNGSSPPAAAPAKIGRDQYFTVAPSLRDFVHKSLCSLFDGRLQQIRSLSHEVGLAITKAVLSTGGAAAPCQDEPTPSVGSDERSVEHLKSALGSSRVASPACAAGPPAAERRVPARPPARGVTDFVFKSLASLFDRQRGERARLAAQLAGSCAAAQRKGGGEAPGAGRPGQIPGARRGGASSAEEAEAGGPPSRGHQQLPAARAAGAHPAAEAAAAFDAETRRRGPAGAGAGVSGAVRGSDAIEPSPCEQVGATFDSAEEVEAGGTHPAAEAAAAFDPETRQADAGAGVSGTVRGSDVIGPSPCEQVGATFDSAEEVEDDGPPSRGHQQPPAAEAAAAFDPETQHHGPADTGAGVSGTVRGSDAIGPLPCEEAVAAFDSAEEADAGEPSRGHLPPPAAASAAGPRPAAEAAAPSDPETRRSDAGAGVSGAVRGSDVIEPSPYEKVAAAFDSLLACRQTMACEGAAESLEGLRTLCRKDSASSAQSALPADLRLAPNDQERTCTDERGLESTSEKFAQEDKPGHHEHVRTEGAAAAENGPSGAFEEEVHPVLGAGSEEAGRRRVAAGERAARLGLVASAEASALRILAPAGYAPGPGPAPSAALRELLASEAAARDRVGSAEKLERLRGVSTGRHLAGRLRPGGRKGSFGGESRAGGLPAGLFPLAATAAPEQQQRGCISRAESAARLRLVRAAEAAAVSWFRRVGLVDPAESGPNLRCASSAGSTPARSEGRGGEGGWRGSCEAAQRAAVAASEKLERLRVIAACEAMVRASGRRAHRRRRHHHHDRPPRRRRVSIAEEVEPPGFGDKTGVARAQSPARRVLILSSVESGVRASLTAEAAEPTGFGDKTGIERAQSPARRVLILSSEESGVRASLTGEEAEPTGGHGETGTDPPHQTGLRARRYLARSSGSSTVHASLTAEVGAGPPPRHEHAEFPAGRSVLAAGESAARASLAAGCARALLGLLARFSAGADPDLRARVLVDLPAARALRALQDDCEPAARQTIRAEEHLARLATLDLGCNALRTMCAAVEQRERLGLFLRRHRVGRRCVACEEAGGRAALWAHGESAGRSSLAREFERQCIVCEEAGERDTHWTHGESAERLSLAREFERQCVACEEAGERAILRTHGETAGRSALACEFERECIFCEEAGERRGLQAELSRAAWLRRETFERGLLLGDECGIWAAARLREAELRPREAGGATGSCPRGAFEKETAPAGGEAARATGAMLQRQPQQQQMQLQQHQQDQQQPEQDQQQVHLQQQEQLLRQHQQQEQQLELQQHEQEQLQQQQQLLQQHEQEQLQQQQQLLLQQHEQEQLQQQQQLLLQQHEQEQLQQQQQLLQQHEQEQLQQQQQQQLQQLRADQARLVASQESTRREVIAREAAQQQLLGSEAAWRRGLRLRHAARAAAMGGRWAARARLQLREGVERGWLLAWAGPLFWASPQLALAARLSVEAAAEPAARAAVRRREELRRIDVEIAHTEEALLLAAAGTRSPSPATTTTETTTLASFSRSARSSSETATESTTATTGATSSGSRSSSAAAGAAAGSPSFRKAAGCQRDREVLCRQETWLRGEYGASEADGHAVLLRGFAARRQELLAAAARLRVAALAEEEEGARETLVPAERRSRVALCNVIRQEFGALLKGKAKRRRPGR